MEVSLVLVAKGPDRLVYRIPLWFRLAMLAIAAILGASIVMAEGSGGVISWLIVALALVGALYEESWDLDRAKGRLAHRYGLLILAKRLEVPLERIESFRIRAFVRGSNPGAPGAAAESSRLLSSADPTNDANALREGRRERRRAYATLLCDDREGGGLVLNTLPLRRAAQLKNVGERLAALAGVELLSD